MSAPLMTLEEVGEVIRRRDRRTILRRLDELGVPTIPMGRSVLVRGEDLDRALAAAVRMSRRGGDEKPAGVSLKRGARLWD